MSSLIYYYKEAGEEVGNDTLYSLHAGCAVVLQHNTPGLILEEIDVAPPDEACSECLYGGYIPEDAALNQRQVLFAHDMARIMGSDGRTWEEFCGMLSQRTGIEYPMTDEDDLEAMYSWFRQQKQQLPIEMVIENIRNGRNPQAT